MSLESDIKAEANNLGFVLSGFSLPNPPQHYPDFLAWIKSGNHAKMTYLSRQDSMAKRADPLRLFPDCRSIVSLVFPYPAPNPDLQRQTDLTHGHISAYALIPDYHQVLNDKLIKLTSQIKKITGHQIRFLSCVDSSPIMEKDYAQSAGLGWVGKNTLLNSPGFGSWIFLSEILWDLELSPDDSQLPDPCFDCDRCLRACPTKALQKNHTIDARKCLSYLTVEHHGPIPEKLRPLIGNTIFGCDLCQTACPHNQSTIRNETLELQPVIDPRPDLFKEFQLNKSDFIEKYQKTPVIRSRYEGFRRNLAIAIGNSGEKWAKKLLEKSIRADEDPIVKEACLWAITRLSHI